MIPEMFSLMLGVWVDESSAKALDVRDTLAYCRLGALKTLWQPSGKGRGRDADRPIDWDRVQALSASIPFLLWIGGMQTTLST